MSKWKCEICNSSFENFDARGFDNKIYCPLCYYKKLYKDTELERERLNNIIENLTTMTVNGDRTQIKNTAQYKIDRAIEYHDNCVNNLLDLDKIEENERLAYRVAYEIHDNYLKILKGVDK